ncbi:MAG TPA: hypothetical protein VNI58_04675, partial [Mariprofundaceae bacterium]|nr:hypothetical protein [Mariprofundaceae bacterium]
MGAKWRLKRIFVDVFLTSLLLLSCSVAFAATQGNATKTVTAQKTPLPEKKLLTRPAPTKRDFGTVWTGWIDSPDVDVNPCPKGADPGERLKVRTDKNGATTRYDVMYRCYLLVPAPKPSTTDYSGRETCGTAWTGWIDSPDADVNPCSKDCEPGEQQIVDANIRNGAAQYNIRYQCYKALPAQSAEQPKVITTPALQITGIQPKVITTPTLQITGIQPKVITTPTLQITGIQPKVITT